MNNNTSNIITISYITDFACTYNLLDDLVESNSLYQIQFLLMKLVFISLLLHIHFF